MSTRNNQKRLPLFVLSILVVGTVFGVAAPAASAATVITITTGNGATTCPGLWTGTTCTTTGELSIASSTTLEVGPGVTLNLGTGTSPSFQNNGVVVNNGTIIGANYLYQGDGVVNTGIIYNFGSLTGSNDYDGVGLTNHGTIYNDGTLMGNGAFVTDGIINFGVIDNAGTLYGINGGDLAGLVNIPDASPGIINNVGIIIATTNAFPDAIVNEGTINDYCGAAIEGGYTTGTGYFGSTPVSCYTTTFEQSGIPASATWGVLTSWGPFRDVNYTGAGASIQVSLTGALAYSFYNPLPASGTTYQCQSGCTGTATVSGASVFSASYAAVPPATTTVTSTSTATSTATQTVTATSTTTQNNTVTSTETDTTTQTFTITSTTPEIFTITTTLPAVTSTTTQTQTTTSTVTGPTTTSTTTTTLPQVTSTTTQTATTTVTTPVTTTQTSTTTVTTPVTTTQTSVSTVTSSTTLTATQTVGLPTSDYLTCNGPAPYLQVGQNTNCQATISPADEGALQGGTVAWHSIGGTFSQMQCNNPNGQGQIQCQAQFTPTSTGVQTLTATYSGDAYHAGSSATFALFVSAANPGPSQGVSGSTVTSAVVWCDQTYLTLNGQAPAPGPGPGPAPPPPAGQTTNCHATISNADGSPVTGTVTWSVSGGATLSSNPPAQCNNPNGQGQIQCNVQLQPNTAGAVKVTASYGGATGHSASMGSFAVFVVSNHNPITAISDAVLGALKALSAAAGSFGQPLALLAGSTVAVVSLRRGRAQRAMASIRFVS